MTIDVLYEDNHCLAVNKPAGILSQGDRTGDASLVTWALGYLKERYRKPGNVYVGLVHRLDRPTSGAMVLARTSKGASRLAAQFREGGARKVYWAIVEGQLPEAQGRWVDRLKKDRGANQVAVLHDDSDEGREAVLDYDCLWQRAGLSKVELRPATGRGHQLRAQLASRGLPIVGDRKYGAHLEVPALDGGPRIALHARELGFKHPTRDEWITIVAPVPADWPEPWKGKLG